MTLERLQKFLARAGIASRRASEKLIVAGRVAINGRVASDLGVKVQDHDRVTLDGRLVSVSTKTLVYVFNKPNNVIVTMKDPRGRPCLADYLTEAERGLHPVGRLDRDSQGLLLLTNDGALTNKLAHPRYTIDKEYYVKVRGFLDQKKLNILENGVELADGVTSPAQVKVLREADDFTELSIVIHEGKNRQIRRMLEAVGCATIALKRIRIGSVRLRGLRPGQKRRLTEAELNSLKKLLA